MSNHIMKIVSSAPHDQDIRLYSWDIESRGTFHGCMMPRSMEKAVNWVSIPASQAGNVSYWGEGGTAAGIHGGERYS
jgi:hypothetical protein